MVRLWARSFELPAWPHLFEVLGDDEGDWHAGLVSSCSLIQGQRTSKGPGASVTVQKGAHEEEHSLYFLCRCRVQTALTNLTLVFGPISACMLAATPGRWQLPRAVFFFPAGVGHGSQPHPSEEMGRLGRWLGHEVAFVLEVFLFLPLSIIHVN